MCSRHVTTLRNNTNRGKIILIHRWYRHLRILCPNDNDTNSSWRNLFCFHDFTDLPVLGCRSAVVLCSCCVAGEVGAKNIDTDDYYLEANSGLIPNTVKGKQRQCDVARLPRRRQGLNQTLTSGVQIPYYCIEKAGPPAHLTNVFVSTSGQGDEGT
jgi:hypothetical protein